jgi:hypothetical protein
LQIFHYLCPQILTEQIQDGATAEYHDICNYWKAEDSGIVTAKIDEQKTDETKQKIQAIVNNL